MAAALPYETAVDKVMLVEQFRAGAQLSGIAPWRINIVVGRTEAGQTPLDTITRESLKIPG